MQVQKFLAQALSAVALVSVSALSAPAIGQEAILTTAEYITTGENRIPGHTIYYNQTALMKFMALQKDVGNGQLLQDFVYDDPRNAQYDGDNPNITFAVATDNKSADLNLTNQLFWFEQSLRVWEREACSQPFLSRVDSDAGFPGIVNIFFQTGNIPPIWVADVTQVGFFSASAFPFFAGNPNVLGVAFTLTWVDANGNLTDIDSNGKADVAFREIYYNDEYEWSDNGAGNGAIDFPTVAIHEAGHGLSAAHFGSIGLKGGTLVANPRTIMNAIYGGPLRQLTGRDRGTHCSNWSQWPLQ